MKRILGLTLILSILIFPTLVWAREIPIKSEILRSPNFISGTITDYMGNPLPGVTVEATTTVNKEFFSFKTYSRGSYAFYDIPTSDDGYIIVASLKEYRSHGPEKIKPGSTLNLRSYQTNPVAIDFPIIFMKAGEKNSYWPILFQTLELAKTKYDWADSPTPEHLESGVGLSSYSARWDLPVIYEKHSDMPDGTKYKSLAINIRSDYPGMAAGGWAFESELHRLKAVTNWAKINSIPIVGLNIENTNLPWLSIKDTEQIINLVAPNCDILVSLAESSFHQIFVKIAEEYEIPLYIAPDIESLVSIFVEIFGE